MRITRARGLFITLAVAGLSACADSGDDIAVPVTPGVTVPPPELTPTPPVAPTPGEVKAITTQYDLRNDMRRLWTDHVAYTRFYLIEKIGNLPGAATTAQRLLRNQADIGNAIKPYFGEDAGARLTTLLQEHIGGAVAVVEAAQGGDAAKLKSALDAWNANADAIARFLSGAGPGLTFEAVRSMMREHLDQTVVEATARLKGDWAGDVVAFDAVVDHILHLADALSDAIAQQFPALVSTTQPVKRADLHVASRKLWEDHVLWTRVFIIDAAGSTPDLEQATKRLLANQDQIGKSIEPFYGAEAAKKLGTLLREHITTAAELVFAAKANDGAKVLDAKARWYANADAIATFLTSANPAFSGVKDVMRMHLDHTLAEATHQLGGDYAGAIADYDMVTSHILQMSDALAGGIASQFPEVRP